MRQQRVITIQTGPVDTGHPTVSTPTQDQAAGVKIIAYSYGTGPPLVNPSCRIEPWGLELQTGTSLSTSSFSVPQQVVAAQVIL